jgi:hypothetical protein
VRDPNVGGLVAKSRGVFVEAFSDAPGMNHSVLGFSVLAFMHLIANT